MTSPPAVSGRQRGHLKQFVRRSRKAPVTPTLIPTNSLNSFHAILTLVLAALPSPVSAGLYAAYRGDTGPVASATGLVTAWRNSAGTPASRNLDRIRGTPQAVSVRTPDGVRTILRCDGTDAVWGVAANFGTLATNRTFIAYCRLIATNNGFLFDGSANAPGLTRAQVRNGSWQVGLQPSGGGSNSDTNTRAATTNSWQAHTFTFERLASPTVVTHTIASGGSLTYTNPLTSGLGGLILGQNVATALGLSLDLAEFLVYDHALSSRERQEITSYLSAKWGSPTDLPPPACPAAQVSRVLPSFGLHPLMNVQVLGAATPLSVTNLTFTLDGTTALADVASLKLFFGGTSSEYRPLNPLATLTGPFTGTLAFHLSQPLSNGVNHFWLAVEPRRGAKWGRQLDAMLTSVGVTDGVRIPEVSSPSGFLTLGNNYSSTVIRRRGDEGVGTYRIPALVASTNGTLIAAFDIRHDSAGDLPANVDVGVMCSTDGGTLGAA